MEDRRYGKEAFDRLFQLEQTKNVRRLKEVIFEE
jgi:hypothetical protein